MAFQALSGNDDLAILTALQHCFQAVEAQLGFVAFLAMATEARRFKEWSDVLGVGDILLGRGGGEFTEIRLGAEGGPAGNGETDQQTGGQVFHEFVLFKRGAVTETGDR